MSKPIAEHPHLEKRSSRPALRFNTFIGLLGQAKAVTLNLVPFTCILGLGALAQYYFTLHLPHFQSLLHRAPSLPNSIHLGALALPLALILLPLLKPTLQTVGLIKNPWMDDKLPGVMYADMPGGEMDEEGRKQSPEYCQVIVGATCNSAFGVNIDFIEICYAFKQASRSWFCFGARQLISLSSAQMWSQLEADPNSGLLK